jgi:L-ascorbate metabolism protein UlaG (beta-lactamase superfamily)
LPQQLTQVNYFLISHEHGDHLDSATVGPAAKASPQAQFIAPGWCVDILTGLDIPSERIMTLPALEPLTLPGTSLRLTTVPAAHYEKEYDEQRGYRWLGFLIEWNGVTFYHAGDTIIYPDYLETLRRLPPADVAMLPVNGRDWFRETDKNITGNLWPNEAARLARDLGWDTLIAGHNDLYPNNTIPMASIVEALTNLAPRQKFKILQPGELLYYVK